MRMDEEEYKKEILDHLLRQQQHIGAVRSGSIMPNKLSMGHGAAIKQYSLAEVQLTNGEMIGMMISASPTLGAHLTKEMATTGFLYIFNETESLLIKADRVAAVKLTKMTTE